MLNSEENCNTLMKFNKLALEHKIYLLCHLNRCLLKQLGIILLFAIVLNAEGLS